MDPSYDYISELLDSSSKKAENGFNGTNEADYGTNEADYGTNEADYVTHVCHTCNTPYDKFSELLRHRKYDHNQHPFWCMICGKEFKDYGGLCAHVRVHSGVNPYQCILCGRSYITHYALETHSLFHWDKPDKTPRFMKDNSHRRPCNNGEQKHHVKKKKEKTAKVKTKSNVRLRFGVPYIPHVKNNSENGEFDFS